MGFVVLHMEKAHGSDSGTTAHIERFIIPKNADPTRTHLNRRLIEYPDGVKDRSAAVQRRLEEAVLTRKIGSNQVRAIRINVSGTHEDMKRIEEEGRLDEWCADNLKYFADTFGKENIVAAHLHRDEETPHIHVTLVPIVKGERKRRKREEQAKKRYRKKPTDTVKAVRRRYYDTAEIKILSRYLCRSDGEIRAAKGHRRLESSPQVHAAVLSGYTESSPTTLKSGKMVEFAAAERNRTQEELKTGEKRNTDREAERGGNHRSRQHRRERRFSFRQ